MPAEEASWSPGSAWPSTEGKSVKEAWPPLSRCEVGVPLAKVITRRELEARGRRAGSTDWTLSVGLVNASP